MFHLLPISIVILSCVSPFSVVTFLLMCVENPGLYLGILGKGPWPNWGKKCRQNVEIGEKILTKQTKLEAYSTIMNI